MKTTRALKITMKADDVAEVMLYGMVGQDMWGGDGVGAAEFRKSVKAIKAKTINLRINSPGGSVFDASAMLAALDEHPARIEVDVDGLAASAASLIAMAGDEIRISPSAMMMIHNPHSMAMGDADEMRRTADLLDRAREQYVAAYMRRPGLKENQVKQWMDAETWWTGQEAVDAGMADACSGGGGRIAAMASPAILARLKYRHTPKAVLAQGNPLTFAVGDCVEWLSEDPDEMCACLEDGCIEEISEGTLTIAGTSLSLKGSADDPAVRVYDGDDEEPCWYLVRASQLRRSMGDDDAGQTGGMGGGMMGAKWEETLKRRAVAARLGIIILAFTHNSKTADSEPDWGSVDKTALPMLAFADHGDGPDAKSSWGYPHHWVEGGGGKDDNGVYTTGTMYLHRGGLNAAWSAAMGGRSGKKAPQAVIDHLQAHRAALGMGE